MNITKLNDLNQLVEKTREIYFRGDTRSPKEIFEFGFQRRGTSFKYFKKKGKIQEPAFRENDIDLTSAVCMTSVFDCSPIFPIEGGEKDTWIYIIQGEKIFPTFLYQKKNMQFCQEIATRDIPSGDVICAIKCERFYNITDKGGKEWNAGMHYRLTSEILWNPKLKNEIETPFKKYRKERIEMLIEERREIH